MADVSKRLAQGTATTTTGQAVYTVPTGKKTFIKAMTFCNPGTQDIQFSVFIANTYIILGHKIKAFDTIIIPYLDQIIEAGEPIAITTSQGNLYYYISGREVDV